MRHFQKEAFDAEATPAPRQRLVIVGNGMSPGRALEKLFEAAPEAYKVTIFNAEPRVNYDRIMLSPVLSGEKTFEEIVIHGDGWYVKHGVTLYKGHRVVAIDRDAKHRDVRARRRRALRQAHHRHRLDADRHSRAGLEARRRRSPTATSTTSTPCCSRRNRAARRW